MENGFVNANIDKAGKKQYSYHGMNRDCLTQQDPDSEDYFINKYGPFPIFEEEIKITTLWLCGEPGWPQVLLAPLGYSTCDPNFVKGDDMHYLWSKVIAGVSGGGSLYNKENILDKIGHKVIAIQSITVYMKGEAFITAACADSICGPGKAKIGVRCTHVVGSFFYTCIVSGSDHTFSYEWEKCKPLLVSERNWDMKTFEEDTKIGFAIDVCREDDPGEYGTNKTRCYYNYCVVKYKKTLVVSLGFQSLEWDIGTTWAILYGKIIGGENGYFIRGFQVWKKKTPGTKIEETAERAIDKDDYDMWEVIHGLTPGTEYKYRALIRNTGSRGDTLFGIIKGFTTKS